MPNYWLFKSEPFKFSWDMLKDKGAEGEEWDGVRNYLARNNMRAMRIGDLGFFYHSNEGKEIVGIAEVCAEAHRDSTTDDERWECVDIRAVCDLPRSVSLADVKAAPLLQQMALVTSMRLSVQPVTPEEWEIVCGMAGFAEVPRSKNFSATPTARGKVDKTGEKPEAAQAPAVTGVKRASPPASAAKKVSAKKAGSAGASNRAASKTAGTAAQKSAHSSGPRTRKSASVRARSK